MKDRKFEPYGEDDSDAETSSRYLIPAETTSYSGARMIGESP